MLPLVAGVIGASVVGAVGQGVAGAIGADKAAGAQRRSTDAAIAEQQRQFDAIKDMLSPYVGVGGTALDQMTALLGLPSQAETQAYETAVNRQAQQRGLMAQTAPFARSPIPGQLQGLLQAAERDGEYVGLSDITGEFAPADEMGMRGPSALEDLYGTHQKFQRLQQLQQRIADKRYPAPTQPATGAERQQAAIEQIMAGPQFQEMVRQGEEAILQNAAATGGVRGGNVQRSLAQFRPQILNQLIQQRLGQLGGLAQMGQSSAARQAAVGQNFAGNMAALQQQRGNIGAQQALARSASIGSAISGIGGGVGSALLMSQLAGKF